MDTRRKTVILDLDGTLVDTGADLIAAANACFRELGHGDLLDPEADKATAFRGGRAMLRLGFARLGLGGEARVDAQYPRLLEHYDDAVCVHSAFYPGAVDAAQALAARGDAVGIATNKPYGLADKLLRALGHRDTFGPLIGADTLAVRKPDPAHFFEAVDRAGGDRARAVLVGDTETDRTTARNAGVASVLVSFGPEGEAVAELAPEALLDRFSDLPLIVDRLLG
ncbi:HAD-IA family hydrolase [Maribius pontilimi]|uniref:phosphoglycolate phosphatase n=1 Tax=Palleronia pontilimi TaxID=1964209 RepID=A0A934IHA0_9RHOB|nr:HAD-IA family hydrolase [Palleronia pontilimi]MBJ3763062.1 HAD-IA family hydrolase [Palleronia pontilimi]